jgi:hypothetical protein
MKGVKMPKRLKRMFHPKATSDDEITLEGPRALAREERSEAADQVIRGVEHLIVQQLRQDGKTRSANIRLKHKVPAFGECRPGQFLEVRSPSLFVVSHP